MTVELIENSVVKKEFQVFSDIGDKLDVNIQMYESGDFDLKFKGNIEFGTNRIYKTSEKQQEFLRKSFMEAEKTYSNNGSVNLETIGDNIVKRWNLRANRNLVLKEISGISAVEFCNLDGFDPSFENSLEIVFHISSLCIDNVIELNDNIKFKPIGKIDERKEIMQNYSQSIRGCKAIIEINEKGRISHLVENAYNKLDSLLKLCGFCHGTYPSIMMAEINENSEKFTGKYLKIYKNHSLVGDGYRKSPYVSSMSTFVSETFNNYKNFMNEGHRIDEGLFYYTSSLKNTKTVEEKITSVIIAIELLAKDHVALEIDASTETRIKIGKLLEDYNVEFQDLTDNNDYYFYKNIRNDIIHANRNRSKEDNGYEVRKVQALFRRIIGNMLLDEHRLYYKEGYGRGKNISFNYTETQQTEENYETNRKPSFDIPEKNRKDYNFLGITVELITKDNEFESIRINKIRISLE